MYKELFSELLKEGVIKIHEAKDKEKKAKEYKFDADEFYKTALKMFKPPSEQAGKFGTEEREWFQSYISDNIKGTTLKEKVASINEMVSIEGEVPENIYKLMSALGAIKILQQTIDDFNPATAGFTFEAFLSGLLKGRQVTDQIGGSLPIEDCWLMIDPDTGEPGQPVSLKLLTGQNVEKTLVEGSIENLLAFFRRDNIAPVANTKGIEYIIAIKFANKSMGLYSFTIKPKDFFFWIDEKNFSFNKYKAAEDYALRQMGGGEVEEVVLSEARGKEADEQLEDFRKAHSEIWPMYGPAPDAELGDVRRANLSQVIKNILPKAAGNFSTKRLQAKTFQGIQQALSPVGVQAFEKYKQLDGAVVDELMEIPSPAEVWEKIEQGDVAEAKRIANILKLRHRGLKTTMQRQSPSSPYAPHFLSQRAAKKIKKQYTNRKMVQQLNELGSGDPKDVVKWSWMLDYMKKKNQFHLYLRTVISHGEDYGEMTFNKKEIYKILEKYSEDLKRQIGPVYKAFADLTAAINGYFILNKPLSAQAATDSLKELKVRVDDLPEIEETPEGMPLPDGVVIESTQQTFENNFDKLISQALKDIFS